MQAPLHDQPTVAIRRVQAVVNPASGGVGPGAADELAAVFSGLGLDHQVRELVPGQLEDSVQAALQARPDLMVVLGGDGTARLVAEMCGPAGPLVAPLCAGTMSKLGRAIYGPRPWREALHGALRRPAARWAPGGQVGGHAFYCRAILGAPALLAPAREAIRARRLRYAWRQAAIAFRKPFRPSLGYQLNGGVGRSPAIALICPTISRALADDEGLLEAAVLNLHNARAGVRLALHNLLSDWREDPNVTVQPCVSGRAWARHSIPAMLDGEFFRMGRHVDIGFCPRAFRALAPGSEADCAA